MHEKISWIQDVDDGSLCIAIDTKLYSLEALFRVCYTFTDRCYLFLQPSDPASIIQVKFSSKTPDADLSGIAAEFSNELINQKVRIDVAAETHAIRELIVAQAFAESGLDVELSEADYRDDPKGIAQ